MKIIWCSDLLFKVKGIEIIKKITTWRFRNVYTSLKQYILSIEPTGIYGIKVDFILNIVHRFEQCFDRIVNVADWSYKDMKILERVHQFNTIHSDFFYNFNMQIWRFYRLIVYFKIIFQFSIHPNTSKQ